MTFLFEGLSALLHSLGELGKNLLGVVPANTSISYAHSVVQASLAFSGDLLCAYKWSDRDAEKHSQRYSPSFI